VSPDLLRIYLQDHRAGAALGSQLAARAQGQNQGTEFEQPLARVRTEIDEDVATLEDVMKRLGVPHDRLKEAAFWTGEKLGRLKLNGRLTGYSPLSRVVELEGLLIGITGKRALWVALELVVPSEPRLEGIDFAALTARADRQRELVETMRRRAGEIAFIEER